MPSDIPARVPLPIAMPDNAFGAALIEQAADVIPVLQTGKLKVALEQIEPAGQYALKLTFSDGHDSGLYTWDYLERLALNQQALWDAYLAALAAAGKSRDPDESVVKLML